MDSKKENDSSVNGETVAAELAVAEPKTVSGPKSTAEPKVSKKVKARTLDRQMETGMEQPFGLVDAKELHRVLTEVKNGNFSVRMPIDQEGVGGKICDTLNEIISLNEKMMQEFTKAGSTIGKQGKLMQRIEV